MQLGNRRFVVLGVVATAVVLALAGCAGPPTVSDAVAVALGKQALSFSSPDSASGWTSSEPCSTSFQTSAEGGAPAGVTITPIDPGSISGPLSDPDLNAGDVATCAFKANSATVFQNQEFFLGMPNSYISKYAAQLVADGFTAGPTVAETQTPGTEQTFTKGNNKVAILYSTNAPGLLAIFG